MVRSDPYIEHCRQEFADLAEMPPWADRVVTEHVEKSRSGVENTSDHDVTPTWWRNAIDIDRVARAFARACRAGVVVSVFADAHQMRVVVYHAGAATTAGALADIRRAIEETPSHSAAVQVEVARREADRRVAVQPDYPDDHWPEGKLDG
jgi:hypothetical protein